MKFPPNGQGLTALLTLNILEGFDLAALSKPPVVELLSKDYAAKRRVLINPNKALDSPLPGEINVGSDTTYFTVVDKDGNAVSFINSLFDSFGSGIVAGDTGMALAAPPAPLPDADASGERKPLHWRCWYNQHAHIHHPLQPFLGTPAQGCRQELGFHPGCPHDKKVICQSFVEFIGDLVQTGFGFQGQHLGDAGVDARPIDPAVRVAALPSRKWRKRTATKPPDFTRLLLLHSRSARRPGPPR